MFSKQQTYSDEVEGACQISQDSNNNRQTRTAFTKLLEFSGQFRIIATETSDNLMLITDVADEEILSFVIENLKELNLNIFKF